MSANIIGAADEFWRVRLTRVDTTDDLDFEWHDDILYREPVTAEADEVELWHIEAVSTDGLDTVVRLRTFDDRRGAQDFLAAASDDLSEMTKTQFESAYMAAADDSAEDEGTDEDTEDAEL